MPIIYEKREFGRAMRLIMELADTANQYVNDQAPWVLAKQEDRLPEVQAICTNALNMFRLLMTYLPPVLPATAAKARELPADAELDWNTRDTMLLDHRINPFKPMMTRVEMSQVEAMLEASRERLPAAPVAKADRPRTRTRSPPRSSSTISPSWTCGSPVS